MGGRGPGACKRARSFSFQPEDETMSEKKEPVSEEQARHPELPARVSHARERGRWGRPSGASIRRTAARVRAGAFPGLNPEVQPSEYAEVLEEMADQEFLESVKNETLEFERACRELDEQERARRERAVVAELYRLKKSAEASDPESPVAERVRQLNRYLRKELGRPRKRKKKV